MQKHFRVPVLPYLKKYVELKFFAGKKGPFKLEEDTLIGKQFMAAIIDARKKDVIDKHIEMSEYIEVELSEVMAERSPAIYKLIQVNFFLDKLFKDALITWIQSAEHFGVRAFPASKEFLIKYGIDESEYSHDAAYKHWLRVKNAAYHNRKIVPRSTNKNTASILHPIAVDLFNQKAAS